MEPSRSRRLRQQQHNQWFVGEMSCGVLLTREGAQLSICLTRTAAKASQRRSLQYDRPSYIVNIKCNAPIATLRFAPLRPATPDQASRPRDITLQATPHYI